MKTKYLMQFMPHPSAIFNRALNSSCVASTLNRLLLLVFVSFDTQHPQLNNESELDVYQFLCLLVSLVLCSSFIVSVMSERVERGLLLLYTC